MGFSIGIGGSKKRESSSGTVDKTQRVTSQWQQANPMQQYGENALLNMLQGYGGAGGYGGQQQLAGQTTGAMQNLLGGAAPQVSPQQQALIEGQTKNFMQGLQQQLAQYSKGAKSGNQQYWQKRGLPGSSMEQGGRSNIDAQMLQQLGQGYTQAKGRELQNMLQYPQQNLAYMQGMGNLQQQYNLPFLQMLQQLGMSRTQRGPMDQFITGHEATTGKGKSSGFEWGLGATSKPKAGGLTG